MKLYPSGLSGDQEQPSLDQLHLEGFLALRAFSNELMETLKMSLSVAALLHVARDSSSARVAIDADSDVGSAETEVEAARMVATVVRTENFILKLGVIGLLRL